MSDLSTEDLVRMIRNPEEELPQGPRLYGVHFGLVEDNKDPLKLGRLKVRTCVHFDVANIPTDSLPWAHYSGPYGGDGTIGFYAVPPIGSQVVVAFVYGDTSYPVWLGTVWGAPDGVSDTYVSTIDEGNPYGVAPVAPGAEWDYTKYNALTTTSGHRFELDDNISLSVNALGEIEGQNFRRIGLEIPGDVDVVYDSLNGTFTKGKRVVGQRSGASGLVIEDVNSTLTLMLPKGKFRDNEKIVDEVGAEATITSVVIKDGIFFRMREDKTQTVKNLSAGSGFRSILEFGTKAGRVMRFDDEERTIRIETPESRDVMDGRGHFFEINSADAFIRSETEFGNYIVVDDPDKVIEISTPGTDTIEKGYRVRIDEFNKRILMKGDDQDFFFELDEKLGRMRMVSPYPVGSNAGIEIKDFYTNAPRQDVVRVFANDGKGPGTNGIMWDRGSTGSGRAQQVYMYNDSSTAPSSWVRVVTAQMGSSDPVGLVEVGESGNNSSAINKLRVQPGIGAYLYGDPDARLIANRNVLIKAAPNDNSVVLDGPWMSKYFKHRHELDVASLLNAGKLVVLQVPSLGIANSVVPKSAGLKVVTDPPLKGF